MVNIGKNQFTTFERIEFLKMLEIAGKARVKAKFILNGLEKIETILDNKPLHPQF